MDEKVQIRISNQTSHRIEEVIVTSYSSNQQREQNRNYGNVEANMKTFYLPHDFVWDYPVMKYNVPGAAPFQCLLFCGNGIYPLEPGRYTLVVEEGHVHFVRD